MCMPVRTNFHRDGRALWRSVGLRVTQLVGDSWRDGADKKGHLRTFKARQVSAIDNDIRET